MVRMTRRQDKAAATVKIPSRKSRALETYEKYPVTDPFTNIEQINEYLGGDFINCLMCGKKLKQLSAHLVKVHDIRADEYRKKYGIPWTYALVGVGTKAKMSSTHKARWDNGESPIINYQLPIVRQKACASIRRPRAACVVEMDKKGFDKIPKTECICVCGKTFVKGPHSMRKRQCDDCYLAKYPERFIHEVEIPCAQCGALIKKGPRSKRIICKPCIKRSKMDRKNAKRRTGRPTGRPGHKPNQ